MLKVETILSIQDGWLSLSRLYHVLGHAIDGLATFGIQKLSNSLQVNEAACLSSELLKWIPWGH